MKIWELLNENDGGSSASAGEHKTKKRDKFEKSSRDSIPGMTRYKDTAAHYYDMYRMGVHMAGSPDHQTMADTGPTSNEFVTLAYTDAEEKIIKKSAKAMGFTGVGISSKGSKETDNTNKVSPIAKPKKNKYGV